MHLLYFAVTVFGNVKDTLMFSNYNYLLNINLVVDCHIKLIKCIINAHAQSKFNEVIFQK